MSTRSKLQNLADYLGATVFWDGRWHILHYGVGPLMDEDCPPGHGAWDCLGRLLGVAMCGEEQGGHGISALDLYDVVQPPYDWSRSGGGTLLMLPGGIDATTDAALCRLVAAHEARMEANPEQETN